MTERDEIKKQFIEYCNTYSENCDCNENCDCESNYDFFNQFGHAGLNCVELAGDVEKAAELYLAMINPYLNCGYGESVVIGAIDRDSDCLRIISENWGIVLWD